MDTPQDELGVQKGLVQVGPLIDSPNLLLGCRNDQALPAGSCGAAMSGGCWALLGGEGPGSMAIPQY
jgi:hypothetical protein